MVEMLHADLSARKKINGITRCIMLYKNKPHPADAFICGDDVMNLLLFVQIMDDERAQSRVGLRFRRKVSKLFTEHWDNITADYRIVHMDDGKNYLRAEFHCRTRSSGKTLYHRICQELFE